MIRLIAVFLVWGWGLIHPFSLMCEDSISSKTGGVGAWPNEGQMEEPWPSEGLNVLFVQPEERESGVPSDAPSRSVNIRQEFSLGDDKNLDRFMSDVENPNIFLPNENTYSGSKSKDRKEKRDGFFTHTQNDYDE